MKVLITKLEAEHQEIYKTLDAFLLDLTKVKNEPDHEHLEAVSAELLAYVRDLLGNHFKIEEKELFPLFQDEKKELVDRLIADHREIEEKYQKVVAAYEDFKKRIVDQYFNDYDYKMSMLFPAYNLIATINHHAIREDDNLF